MQGQCLCGAVEIMAPENSKVSVCHCSMCRRWSGGPLFSVHCPKGVTTKGDALKTYRSSDCAERGFCEKCGTHLFYHLLPNDEYVLPVGLFQENDFTLVSEIFIDEKPHFYELKNETHKMTGQQVFDQFAQP